MSHFMPRNFHSKLKLAFLRDASYKKPTTTQIKSENFKILRIVMSERKQNLVVFMEPSEEAWHTPLKRGNMILNRFCIDEDAAFELSGVHSLKKSSKDVEDGDSIEFKLKRKEKGKKYSF